MAAQVPYNEGVATVTPEASTPNDYLSSSAATPAAFGGQLAEGAQKLGQGAEQDDRAGPVPAVRVVPAGERGGEVVAFDLAVPVQDVEEVAGHLGVVGPRPGAVGQCGLVEEQWAVRGGEELRAEGVAGRKPGKGVEAGHRAEHYVVSVRGVRALLGCDASSRIEES